MKKTRINVVVLILMCSILLSAPALAVNTRASDQISAYAMNVLPASNSRIAIEFSITGANKMSVIGAKSIAIYKNNGTSWEYVGGFTQDSDGMTRTDAYNYGNTIYYDGESGEYYRVHVTVFAKDSSGASDSRSSTFYITTN